MANQYNQENGFELIDEEDDELLLLIGKMQLNIMGGLLSKSVYRVAGEPLVKLINKDITNKKIKAIRASMDLFSNTGTLLAMEKQAQDSKICKKLKEKAYAATEAYEMKKVFEKYENIVSSDADKVIENFDFREASKKALEQNKITLE